MTPNRTKGIVGRLTKQCSHAEPGAAPDRRGMERFRDVQLTDAPPASELGR
jgi:hypothetical protein